MCSRAFGTEVRVDAGSPGDQTIVAGQQTIALEAGEKQLLTVELPMPGGRTAHAAGLAIDDRASGRDGLRRHARLLGVSTAPVAAAVGSLGACTIRTVRRPRSAGGSGVEFARVDSLEEIWTPRSMSS